LFWSGTRSRFHESELPAFAVIARSEAAKQSSLGAGNEMQHWIASLRSQ
jgi:hypothetical protein